MKKKLLTERFQQLAGIKPLYTEQSDTDDYGRSISGKDKRTFVDPKDLMPAARAKKMLDMDGIFYEKVEFVYTEQGGHFYGLDVYENKDQDQRSDKLRYDEANEWLKDTLSDLDVDIPKRYGSGEKELDDIVEKLEDLGIEASHGDYMDVS
tara:strand:- start:33 stop:485 length:453 start_codon:yes stop_codon:yes gene_type:complete